MNLAYTLNDEQIFKIQDETQTFVNNVISLDKYKDAKIFVDVVNNKKIFIQALFLLESIFRNKIKKQKELSLDTYKKLIDVLEDKVQEIKHNANKTMKKKYLRLDSEQLDIFAFLKQRYAQISDPNDELTQKIEEDFIGIASTESGCKPIKDKYKSLSNLERMQFALGISYSYFKKFDADILNPVVKKLIKEALKLNKKHALSVGPNPDYEEANKEISQSYKKVLEKLAK